MTGHLRHHTTGQRASWRFDTRPQHASDRFKAHGPIQPMEEPGFLARIFGRSR